MKKLLSYITPRSTKPVKAVTSSITPGLIVPRGELVKAIAQASYDGNKQACAAGWRLLRAIDDSGNDYLRV